MNKAQKRPILHKVLSMILALVMVLSLLPVSALAETDASNSTDEFMRIFHLDCGRKYFSVNEIEKIIDTLAENHYTHIQLAFGNDGLRFLLDDMSVTVGNKTYSSDDVKKTVKNANKTYAESENALTQNEMDQIIEYANKNGIEVIPLFNAPGHMISLAATMKSLGISESYEGTFANYQDGQTTKNVSINPGNASAKSFIIQLLTKYVKYFAEKGSTMFNMGADESHLDKITYSDYAALVNEMAGIIKEAKMTPLAYNDGIGNEKYNTESYSDFDKDIIICYWTTGDNQATAEELAKKFKILNNTNDWYYVLGDGLYSSSAWGNNGQWGYDSALKGVTKTNVMKVKGDDSGKVTPIGSVLCVWCDVPSMGYNSSGVKTSQTSKECVLDLIKAMADANPEYFTDMVNLPAEDTSSDASVIVRGHKGDNASVTVTQITESQYKSQFTADASVSYEITPTVEGEAYIDEGTVTLPVPAEWEQNASRICAYIITDGKVVTIKGTLTDGKYTFKVPHFSEMGLLQVAAPTYETIDISIPVGGAVTKTVKGSASIVTAPNSSVATAKVTTVAAGKTLTQISSVDEIKSGAQYVIYNERYGGYLTSNTVTDQGHTSLGLNQADKSKLDENSFMWTITKREGSNQFDITYNNEYLNVPQNNKAEISSTKPTNAFSITPATKGEMLWTVSQNDYYLNNLGEGKAVGGWSGTGASIDDGSQWYIFRVDETTDQTKITFTAAENANIGDTTTAIIGDKQYNITIVEKKQVEIPITIVDYRADGLLFDYTYMGDSYRYGLVHGKRNDNSSTSVAGTIDSSTGLYYVDGNGNSVEKILGTKIEQTGEPNAWFGTSFKTNSGDGSWSRAGLVQEELGSNGMPVYTDAAVEYVASLLAEGCYNIMSESCNAVLQDTFLKPSSSRSVIDSSTSEFSTAFANSKTYANIQNAYDLAWYLLNTLYQPDTNMTTVTGTDGNNHNVPIYGMGVDAYKSIVLTPNEDGTAYSFEAGYSSNPKSINYDRTNGVIIEDSSAAETEGFYPLEGLGYEQDGLLTNTSAIKSSVNGSFTLRGESQFVYNADKDLYFTFTGDDDVYMYINGVLALDLGGAHGRNTKTVKLNELDQEKYGLTDGSIATFTFFYMERCSDASTFGIETNMELVKRDIDVQKLAYSDTSYNTPLSDGSVVNNGNTIAYDLVVTNNGNSTMNNISFSDTDTFGGSASFGAGVQSASVTAGTADGTLGGVTLGESSSYTIFVTDADGSTVVADSQQTFSSLSDLSSAVADITLQAGQSLHVRFLTATTDVQSSKMLSYTNTVQVTANSGDSSLSDSASHTIYSYNANDTDKTYVVDFGLPVNIAGIFDSTSKEYIVDKELAVSQQPTYGKEITLEGTGFGTSFTYELKDKTTIDGLDTIKLSVDYKFSGNIINLDKTINIIPASTVYYEDSFASFTDGDDAAVGATWSDIDNNGNEVDSKTYPAQALEALGAEGTNVYGYDDEYKDSTKYSMGSAHKVTVTADMVNNWTDDSAWPTATFTFKGTGFDIISLTDNTSGTIFVDVVNSNGKTVKSLFVDNYYGYTYNKETGKWEVNKEASDALYQIPVMKVTGLDYDTYTVRISLEYDSFFDHIKANEYTFVLDAIRVYEPMGESGNSYYKYDNEGYPQYIKLRDTLAGAKDSSDLGYTLFIDGADKADIATYANYGPNNEVYLANGQAISFKIPANSNIASIQIGAKAPDDEAAKMTVKVAENAVIDGQELMTATEMYYQISDNGTDDKQVIITNNGDGILSLTNLKITYKDNPGDAKISLEKLSSEEQTQAVQAVRALFAAPVVEPFAPERFEAEWNSVRAGRQATLTVKTSTDVESITVNGVTVDSCKTRYERSGWGWWAQKVEYREFSYTVKATETTDYDVCAVNADGLASDPITATLTVKPTQNSWWNNWWNGIFDKWF